MSRPSNVLVLVACTALAGTAAQAGDRALPEEAPLAGRPKDYSGAIGTYRVSTRAQPTELQAEDPLTFTVRITGTGPLEKLQRPDLRRLPRFAERFHIEDAGDRTLPEDRAREFDYRLRPRNAAVKEVPPLPFTYFKPGVVPEYRGFQTTYAPAVPLTVKPRAGPPVAEGAPPVNVPESLYQITLGPSLLREDRPSRLPGPLALGALLLGPPLLGFLSGLCWRRLHPDAGRRARRQQSRAGRQALRALRQIKTDGVERPRAVLSEYLRQRTGFAVSEPTPAEVVAHLCRGGWSAAVAEKAAGWFAACDAARFGPRGPAADEASVASAVRLVGSLELSAPRPLGDRDWSEGVLSPPSPWGRGGGGEGESDA
jgi:hypothetical protein